MMELGGGSNRGINEGRRHRQKRCAIERKKVRKNDGKDRTEQDRTGQDRTGQDRTGQDRTGEDRTGQDRTGGLYRAVDGKEKKHRKTKTDYGREKCMR